jgi:hypothetical protein
MPVNLMDISKSISKFAGQAKVYFTKEAAYLAQLEQVLRANASRLEDVKKAVEQESQTNSRLRCAVPIDEPLDAAIPVSAMPERISLLASDGSQINPSRHARVPFCVINIGAVEMVRGSGQTPRVFQESLLLDYERTTLPETGIISEGRVALVRDLLERQKLAELSSKLSPPAIAMIDGPLELYREPQQTADYGEIAKRFQDVLTKLQAEKVIPLGYVDKPGSDLLVTLLEVLGKNQRSANGKGFPEARPVRVVDTAILKNILVKPGERSAVFRVLSPTGLDFGSEQELHFFFMNVGMKDFQHLARVEVPAWVAIDKEMIAQIQAALLDQVRIMGSKPYPYLLHRAHEVALVSMDEHQRVEDLIISEFIRENIPVGRPSQKQAAKDLMD